MNKKSFFQFFILLLCFVLIEIKIKSFSHPLLPNLLLLYFFYLLYLEKSIYQIILCLFCLECTTFLQTGIAGISFFITVPALIIMKQLQKFFYIKQLAPLFFIIIYEYFFEFILSYFLQSNFFFFSKTLCILIETTLFSFILLFAQFPKTKSKTQTA
ncbi:hypothetical protein HYV11_03105 [Candidatus Dependentiae bacterium]|nr:hypothetical protein [Candidatus Dependentiae bacterium]